MQHQGCQLPLKIKEEEEHPCQVALQHPCETVQCPLPTWSLVADPACPPRLPTSELTCLLSPATCSASASLGSVCSPAFDSSAWLWLLHLALAPLLLAPRWYLCNIFWLWTPWLPLPWDCVLAISLKNELFAEFPHLLMFQFCWCKNKGHYQLFLVSRVLLLGPKYTCYKAQTCRKVIFSNASIHCYYVSHNTCTLGTLWNVKVTWPVVIPHFM